LANGEDEAGFFSNRDEFGRRHHAKFRVVPAQQCFHTRQMAGVEAHLRLVNHGQFVAGQRLLQRQFEAQPAGSIGIHRRGVETKSVSATFLCPSQGHVGCFQEFFSIVTVARRDRDTDAGRQRKIGAVNQERGGDGIEHTLGQRDRIVLMGDVGHDETELVATTAADGIALAHLQAQATTDFDQYCVTDGRPEGVVDGSESVQVKEDDSGLPLVATHIHQALRQTIRKQPQVGQISQRIVGCEVLYARCRFLALGQVAEDGDEIAEFALCIAYGGDAEPFSEQHPVLSPIGDFTLPVAVL